MSGGALRHHHRKRTGRRAWVPEAAWRMCARKVRHMTRDAAEQAIAGIGDATLRSYRCDLCGRFHVGHSKEGGS